MHTLLLYWLVTTGGVATNSVVSVAMPSLSACEEYAKVLMADPKVMQYQCIEVK